MARPILSAVMTLLAAMLTAYFTFVYFFKESNVSRSIHVKGEFLLSDESDLLHRLTTLSERNQNKSNFLNKVYSMLDNEPYISSSSIRYSWPDSVVIEITEVKSIAIVNERQLLLEDCGIIDINSDLSSVDVVNLNIVNKKINRSQCEHVLELLSNINAILDQINSITLLANNDYVLDFNKTRLIIGKEHVDKFSEKLIQIVKLIKTDKLKAEYIDMRYVSGAAISRI